MEQQAHSRWQKHVDGTRSRVDALGNTHFAMKDYAGGKGWALMIVDTEDSSQGGQRGPLGEKADLGDFATPQALQEASYAWEDEQIALAAESASEHEETFIDIDNSAFVKWGTPSYQTRIDRAQSQVADAANEREKAEHIARACERVAWFRESWNQFLASGNAVAGDWINDWVIIINQIFAEEGHPASEAANELYSAVLTGLNSLQFYSHEADLPRIERALKALEDTI